MPKLSVLRTGRLLLAAALTVAGAMIVPAEVRAQMVVVLVNGDPITTYDIEQRTKLIHLSGGKTPTRQAVIDELIEEKLKLQLLRRYVIDTIDTEVNNAFANMARRMRLSPQQFTENLAKQGISATGLKSRIKAELIWGQVIRGKFQSSFQFADKDILAKLEAKGEKPPAGHDFTLRPILFVAPKATPQVLEAKRKQAEALRARFTDCQTGIAIARGMPEVAVRPPVVRSSADLPAPLRDLLEKTEIGKLTPPETTAQGIELFALCGKKESDAENVPGKREVREQLVQEQYQRRSKEYMKELRSQAMIEYK